MGVILNCPNCGAAVGEASHEDNYKEKFYNIGNDGQPICQNCGAGTFKNMRRNIFIFAIITIGIMIILAAYFS